MTTQLPELQISTCVQAALHTGAGRCACGWRSTGCPRCGNSLVNARVTTEAIARGSLMCGPEHCAPTPGR